MAPGMDRGAAMAGQELAKLLEINMSCAPAFIQDAGVTASREGEPIVQENRARYAADANW